MTTWRWLFKGMLLLLFVVFSNHLAVQSVFSATDNVPRITAQELKAKMDKGEKILIIDTRTGNEYEGSRIKIKGAMRISIVKIEEMASQLPRDREIVTYCT